MTDLTWPPVGRPPTPQEIADTVAIVNDDGSVSWSPTEADFDGIDDGAAADELSDNERSAAGTAWDWKRTPDGWYSGPDTGAFYPLVNDETARAVVAAEELPNRITIYRAPIHSPRSRWQLGIGFDDNLATLGAATDDEATIDAAADAALTVAGLRRTSDWSPHETRGADGWRRATVDAADPAARPGI